jgi:putative oxidoreductase
MNTLTLGKQQSDRIVNVALWSAQAVLVVVFAWAAMVKLAMPIDDLVARMGLSAGTLRFIALVELAAAVALSAERARVRALDPLVTRTKSVLSGLAGAGLALVMALAAGYHLGRGEVAMIPANAMLGTLALFVAWGLLKR